MVGLATGFAGIGSLVTGFEVTSGFITGFGIYRTACLASVAGRCKSFEGCSVGTIAGVAIYFEVLFDGCCGGS